jgi:serine beta-lactamase-like protein LACTB
MKQPRNSSVRSRCPLWIHLAALIVFCSAVPVRSIAQASQLAPEKRSQIEAAVSRFMKSSQVPGVSVAIVENGEYEWAQGFGFADLKKKIRASDHTLFRLASISKSLTATAAMQLWERGKLDLDAPVQKYCPAFPEKPQPISTRQLLGHLGGIRHYKADSPDNPETHNTRHFDDPIQGGLTFFKNDPLVAEPGTSFHYSTYGYTVVGCIIEGASGTKYVDFVQRNVFTPAGMSQTQVDNRLAEIPDRTHFYKKEKSGAVLTADPLDSSYKIPGGGWLSSAVDMAKFEVAILNDKLIRRTTRDLMWTPLKPSDGSKDNYALGWGWGEQKPGTVAGVGHTGGQEGTSTSFIIAPDQRAGVVVLANMQDVDVTSLAREILNTLAAAPENKP